MHLVSLWKSQENISGRPYARVIRYLFFVSHYPKGKRGHHYFPNFCPACWSSFNGNMSQLDRSGRDWNSDPLHVSRASLERHGGCSFYSVFFFFSVDVRNRLKKVYGPKLLGYPGLSVAISGFK